MSEARAAACRLAKALFLPLTFRNLYVIEHAIEAEIAAASCTIDEAVGEISRQAAAARELGENVNYFWFEDSGWRFRKITFQEQEEMRMRRKARWY